MIRTFALVVELLYNNPMHELWAQNGVIIVRLGVAVVLGMFIGLERFMVREAAGMKTHAMVSLGAAVFMIISETMTAKYAGFAGLSPTMIVSQIIVGIGFLGAGSIILQGSHLIGLTTAGGLWVTAGIGMAAGLGFYSLAIITTALVLFILVIVNKLEEPLRTMVRDKDVVNSSES